MSVSNLEVHSRPIRGSRVTFTILRGTFPFGCKIKLVDKTLEPKIDSASPIAARHPAATFFPVCVCKGSITGSMSVEDPTLVVLKFLSKLATAVSSSFRGISCSSFALHWAVTQHCFSVYSLEARYYCGSLLSWSH